MRNVRLKIQSRKTNFVLPHICRYRSTYKTRITKFFGYGEPFRHIVNNDGIHSIKNTSARMTFYPLKRERDRTTE